MRITTKFIGSSALLIVLSASLFGGSYTLNRQSRKMLGTIHTQAETTVATVAKLDVALEAQVVALSRIAVLGQEKGDAAAYERSRQQFFQALDALSSLTFADQQLTQLQIDGIRRQYGYLEKVAGVLLTSPADGLGNQSQPESQPEPQPEPQMSEDQSREIVRSLKIFEQSTHGHIQALAKSAKEQTAAYQMRHEAFHTQIGWLQMLSFGSVILMLVAQFYYLLRPVTQSLRRLQAGAERINLDQGQGPLAKIHIHTGDELQALADAFNQMSDRLSSAYQNLELQVTARTASLYQANQSLLEEVRDRLEAEASLKQALAKLKQTQLQLLQTEKMSSLGQLVAGVAHEINNPVSFIRGNLEPAQEYMNSLLSLINRYQVEYPESSDELRSAVDQADLTFIQADFPQLLASMHTGAERISQIVRSLQTFSHLDESDTKSVDLHEGLESAIFLLTTQLSATAHRPAIEIKRHYGQLPQVYCYPGQLNQVFMGILTNAIEALSPSTSAGSSCLSNTVTSAETSAHSPTITVTTETVVKGDVEFVRIRFSDNGQGISEAIRRRIFDPFFTTKPVGSGIGLGLSMSYQIMVVNHKGKLLCDSQPGQGATFTLEIPLNLQSQQASVEPVLKITSIPGLLVP